MDRTGQRRRAAGWAGLMIVAMAATAWGRGPAGAFALKDGDRVVLLGGTFIERDQEYGYLETLLTARFADRGVTFRNLGWSGDTVRGEARARFGPPSEGFAHLKAHVEALKPTAIVVNYGLNESFAGKPGLAAFAKDLNTLLDVLDRTGARVVLVTPRRLESLPKPMPDPASANDRLADYVAVLKAAADRRGYRVVDLFDGWKPDPKHPLTDDEVHLTAEGYARAAEVIAGMLGLDGAADLGPTDRLRDAINAKNRLYFYRWRPQNETYLFGFRKHEQGNNAREVPLFDPLVAAKEAEIAGLRRALVATPAR